MVEIKDADTGAIIARREFRTYRWALRYLCRATSSNRNGARMHRSGPDGGWLLMDEPRANVLPHRARPALRLVERTPRA